MAEYNIDNDELDELSSEDQKLIEEYENSTNEDIISNYSDSTAVADAASQYLKDISIYRMLSQEEMTELFIKYNNGDEEAKKKIIEHNLKLVLFVIKSRFRPKNSDEFADYIQQGNLGLIRAVEKYDINHGTTFATYAFNWIYQSISRKYWYGDGQVHITYQYRQLFHKYRKFAEKFFNANGRYPNDEEIINATGIKREQLAYIHEIDSKLTQLTSLNMKIGDDGDSEVGDMVESHRNDYSKFDNDVSMKSLYYHLKQKLTDKEYFVLYYRFYVEPQLTLEDVGEIFGVTRERIRQIEAKALQKSKFIVKKNVPDNFHIEEKDLNPFPFQKKVIMLYLKDILTPYEYLVLYNVWFSDVYDGNLDYIISNTESVYSCYKRLLSTYGDILNNYKNYKEILENVLKTYSVDKIFNIDLSQFLNICDAVNQYNYRDILHLLGDEYYLMSDKDQELIDEYFDVPYSSVAPSELEKIFIPANLIYNNYYKDFRYKRLPLKKLYDVYLEHKDEFAETVQDDLETYLFNCFTNKKSKGKRERHDFTFPILRLETFYYNIDSYFEMHIPNEELFEIMNKYSDKFNEIETQLLTLKFKNNLSIKEMVKVTDLPYDKVRDNLWDAYERAVNISLGVDLGIKIDDMDRYYEYIMNPEYEFHGDVREICRLYFIENRDYEYIRNLLKYKDTTKISNIITEKVRRFDFQYFGITYDNVIPPYPEEFILPVLDSAFSNELEKTLIKARFIDLIPLKTLCTKYNVEIDYLIDLMDEFREYYIATYKDYEVNINDIIDELNLLEVESVLTENDRQILSLYYGIKNEYNISGKNYSYEEIADILNISVRNCFRRYESAKERVRDHKFKFIIVNFETLKKDELEVLLEDPHLPISEVERNLIKAIKGIGREAVYFKNLEEEFNESQSSILRRMYRALCSIKKYLNGEIPGQLNFEYDIKPILRYFPQYDQELIRKRYEENYVTADFKREYKLSLSQASALVQRIEKRICYLLKYPNSKRFDFDYAKLVMHNDDLPFYGNKELTIEIYNKFFGENGYKPQLMSSLDNEYPEINLSRMYLYMKMLMVAVLKYKDNYRKANTFTIEEIKEYYEINKDNLSEGVKKEFIDTIKKFDNYAGSLRLNIARQRVIYELMKSRDGLHYDKDTPIDEIIEFILKNPYNYSRSSLLKIRKFFCLSGRQFMSGKEKQRVVDIVTPFILNKAQEINNENNKAKSGAIKLHKSGYLYTIDPNDDVKSISNKFASGEDNRVLVVDQNLEYVFAYIFNVVKNIDFLTNNDFIKLYYYFQKYILMNISETESRMILSSKLNNDDFNQFKYMNPYLKTFFQELVNLDNPNIDFSRFLVDEERMKHLFPISVASNTILSNRIKDARVNMVSTPSGLYDEINLGRVIDRSIKKYTKDDIMKYLEYLRDNGMLLAAISAKNVDFIPEIFDYFDYGIVNFKTKFGRISRDVLVRVKKK